MWEEHSDVDCSVCVEHQMPSKGGRRKKCGNKPGRPPLVSPLTAIKHHIIVYDQRQCTDNSTDFITDLTCPLCFELVERPVELTVLHSRMC